MNVHVHDLDNIWTLDKKMSESSPSYPSLLPECDLKKIPVVHFTFNVRQYTQESSFLTLRDKKPVKLEKSV